jgi:hypothetical protein
MRRLQSAEESFLLSLRRWLFATILQVLLLHASLDKPTGKTGVKMCK